jgi:hypothetical protein
MANMGARIGTTPSELMFFHGAPLAHVVEYYEQERSRRQAKLRGRGSAREYRRAVDWLESVERELTFSHAVMRTGQYS